MSSADPPFQEPDVATAFARFSEPARSGLLQIRRVIFETARATPEVGHLQETLKWGQPAYLTPHSKSGSTLRLGAPKSGGFAIYAHCQTSIVPAFRDAFGNAFSYDGNRGVMFDETAKIEPEKLRPLILHALTYHLR